MLLAREGLTDDAINQVASVVIAMDLAAVLMCYDIFVPEGHTCSSAAEELRAFKNRATENEAWFKKNYSIKSFIDYIAFVFPYFANKFDEKAEKE